MKIKNIKARKILNSRAEWTIEAEVITTNTKARASVPAGKSTGKYEAKNVPVREAVENINQTISSELVGMNVCHQQATDEKLLKLDGTKHKSNLGANSLLAVSLAAMRACAQSKQKPLWQEIRDRFKIKTKARPPFLFMNIINGGLHAGNSLDFQEYMIVPQIRDVKKSLEIGVKFYLELKNFLYQNFGPQSTNIGDEGGFCPNFYDNQAPLRVLAQIIEKLNLKNNVKFSLDIAASNLRQQTTVNRQQNNIIYKLSGSSFTNEGMIRMYQELAESFPLFSIEDPLAEEDFKGFARLKQNLQDTLIIGDDLTVTNPEKIEKAARMKAMDAVIIKPNQIGTLTETLEAIRKATENNIKIIISHRSGETNDHFIADLSYAIGAFGLKAGAPARGERTAKYNRLLEIAA